MSNLNDHVDGSSATNPTSSEIVNPPSTRPLPETLLEAKRKLLESMKGSSSPRSSSTESPAEAANAILENRRRALQSLKRRKTESECALQPISDVKKGERSAADVVLNEEDVNMDDALAQSIEDQVAELEREVTSLQATADEIMDLDRLEEGEIHDPSPPPTSSVKISQSLPLRGIKRPNAEDMMDNRPVSLPSRVIPPSKRRTFGGKPQQPNRLILTLDDSDDDDEFELSTPPVQEQLLAEHEAKIQLLRDQIAEKMRLRKLEARKAAREMMMSTPEPVLLEVTVDSVVEVVKAAEPMEMEMADGASPVEVVEVIAEEPVPWRSRVMEVDRDTCESKATVRRFQADSSCQRGGRIFAFQQVV